MATFEEMLISFDAMVLETIGSLCYPYSDFVYENFWEELLGSGALGSRRGRSLKIITRELRRVYQKSVVVLIDEYDSPMHSAIELGYVAAVHSVTILLYCSYLTLCQANSFFATVFSLLLKVCRHHCLRHRQLTSFDRAIIQCLQV